MNSKQKKILNKKFVQYLVHIIDKIFLLRLSWQLLACSYQEEVTNINSFHLCDKLIIYTRDKWLCLQLRITKLHISASGTNDDIEFLNIIICNCILFTSNLWRIILFANDDGRQHIYQLLLIISLHKTQTNKHGARLINWIII